ncbi:MAG: YaaR family protein [Treponema sp.]|jgi:uncharacterized protein YaaR (DUF327 family)|nr:YaaR family protein [Treponema sp.]
MAKVDFTDTSSYLNPAAYTQIKADTKRTKDKDQIDKTKKARFASIFDETKADESSETEAANEVLSQDHSIKDLLDDVHSSGERLKSRPFPEEIKQYKRAVRNFLHYIVENGYIIEEQVSGTNPLRRKKFTLVQVIDKKLEQLAAGILAGQIDQLEILAKVDEIKGILVDWKA